MEVYALKKILACIVCLAGVLGCMNVHADGIKVYYDEKSAELKGYTYIENNIIMLPLREVAEDAQYLIKWVNESQTVRLIKGNDVINVPIGAQEVEILGEKIQLTAPVTLRKGTTYVPVDYIEKLLDAVVSWDAKSNTLKLSAKPFYIHELLGSASMMNKNDNPGLFSEFDYESIVDASKLLLANGGKYQAMRCELSVSDDSYSGYQALKIKSIAEAPAFTNMQRIVSDEILTYGAGKYRISFRVKSVGGPASLVLQCQPGGGPMFTDKTTQLKGDIWEKYTVEFDVDPGKYNYFVINFGTYNAGSTLLLDNFCFEKIS